MNDNVLIFGSLAAFGVGAAILSGVQMRSTAKKLDISVDELQKGAKQRITDAAVEESLNRAAKSRVASMTATLENTAVRQVKEAVNKVVDGAKDGLVQKAVASITDADLEIDKTALKNDIYRQTLDKLTKELYGSIKNSMPMAPTPSAGGRSSIEGSIKAILDSDLTEWRQQELIQQIINLK